MLQGFKGVKGCPVQRSEGLVKLLILHEDKHSRKNEKCQMRQYNANVMNKLYIIEIVKAELPILYDLR